MSKRSWNSQKNVTCRVCGADSEDKVCAKCAGKYSELYDLNTPDGRYAARVAEQGTSDDRFAEWQRKEEAKRIEMEQQCKPLVDEISAKLDAASDDLRCKRYGQVSDALQGVEALAQQLSEFESKWKEDDLTNL